MTGKFLGRRKAVDVYAMSKDVIYQWTFKITLCAIGEPRWKTRITVT